MNKDQRKALLHHVAENEDALFVFDETMGPVNIIRVLNFPQYDWRIYDKWEAEKVAEKEGKTIQFKNDNTRDWCDCNGKSGWQSFNKYRIKPTTTELRWLWATKQGLHITSCFRAEAFNEFTVRLDYTATSFEVEN